MSKVCGPASARRLGCLFRGARQAGRPPAQGAECGHLGAERPGRQGTGAGCTASTPLGSQRHGCGPPSGAAKAFAPEGDGLGPLLEVLKGPGAASCLRSGEEVAPEAGDPRLYGGDQPLWSCQVVEGRLQTRLKKALKAFGLLLAAFRCFSMSENEMSSISGGLMLL